MKWNTRKITGLAMVSAISYVVMLIGFRFMPSAQFLKYEAKDVILTIGGFIYGPLEVAVAAVVVALAEMATVSESGPIGFIMNVLAAASYACVAAFVYKKFRTAAGAAVGLALGSLSLAAVMLLWNYLITPLYMNVPRNVVAGMLLPVFLPFNLIKAALNSAFVLLIYKPLISALRQARLLPDRGAGAGAGAQQAGSQANEPQLPSKPASGAPQGFRVNQVILIGAIALLLVGMAAIFIINRS